MYKLQNYMEILVEECLDELLAQKSPKNQQIITAPLAVAEIKAEALNHLAPFYVTCKEGEVYGYSNGAISQNKADIMIEVVKAIEVVINKML